MKFKIEDETESTAESTEPVAPGTSNDGFCSKYDMCYFSVPDALGFLS
ncbi:hypothetical protein M0R88_08170 [Halorussus gelatinilyticus]|uniref:Uncharacterized protein n=1 Tax=Halorussus gelatinilyticus TaxID=2937524 RepID=A0A8U0ILP5_9EURY|nr:hypothetical protein [Halorussus gelatinilyticus]UPW02057.1 hypothetical protein M0R88_08170 [Halorussus gelatinilyticus]